MLVVHAVWSGHRLHFWAERPPTGAAGSFVIGGVGDQHVDPRREQHPFTADTQSFFDRFFDGAANFQPSSVRLRLPTRDGAPEPSPHLAHSLGVATDRAELALETWSVPTAAVAPEDALATLSAIVDRNEHLGAERIVPAESVRFLFIAALVARRLLAEQRFIPNVAETQRGEALGVWRLWLADPDAVGHIAALLRGMPPAARAADDAFAHDGWAILNDYLGAVTDAMCRAALSRDGFIDAIDGRDPAADPHVAWLAGLLDRKPTISADSQMRSRLVRGVRGWLSRLDERGADSRWRVGFDLSEPDSDKADARWRLAIEIRSIEHPETRISAADLWAGPADAATVGGLHLDSPHDLLLGELARAARVYPLLERAIEREPEPDTLELTTSQAYDFLREIRPLLIQQGFDVRTPDWWGTPASRLALTLELASEDSERPDTDPEHEASFAANGQASLGLDALVDYRWRISIGDTHLTTEEFDELLTVNTPLVRISGKWIELRPEDVRAARRFLGENPGGSTTLGAAMRLAFAVDTDEAGLHVREVRAEGWAAALFDPDVAATHFEAMDQPNRLSGILRPYQKTGLAWLTFLDRVGLGACLADDMGLGKTIQLLALVQAENEGAVASAAGRGPTLVVAPLSVLWNWSREAARFTPELNVLIHHGPDRPLGEAFECAVADADIVITTYALVTRDEPSLTRVRWRRVVLDEAQNIKNPSAKQTRSIMRLPTARRVALTGTPVENRLSELWSIMNYCNEGYLGTLSDFRRRFSTPIERRHSKGRAEQLRSLTRPFILRRLKSDPAIAADLPEKIQNRVFAHLTAEQASLYERAVEGMLDEVDRAEGMRRRGVVLATLIRLKQICNHPAQALREPANSPRAIDPRRSGKTQRLIEMLDEVLAEDQGALLFTQFRQMGHMLSGMLRKRFDRDVLFLHGGTPEGERRRLIDRFQAADGSAPIFVLSLKAGGFGLNLTAASHVFHFDRWWNPAVENQATDRAHRIGQTRTVHVHKFVVAGTLEERIDRMIEEKTDLADRIIGAGERGLTELSTDRLRELLTLRTDALDDEPDIVLSETLDHEEEITHGV